MIHLKDINNTYDNGTKLHVLKGVSLDINEGEFVSIMGASGSGKSTLLNIMGILDNYDSGDYTIDGVEIKKSGRKSCSRYKKQNDRFHIPIV